MNVEQIMECILPYHETKQFVQVVQTLALVDGTRWTFLRPIQDSNVHLGRTLLVRRCAKDHSLLPFICDMVSVIFMGDLKYF